MEDERRAVGSEGDKLFPALHPLSGHAGQDRLALHAALRRLNIDALKVEAMCKCK